MVVDEHANIDWSESRQELMSWFQRNTPPLGTLYEGALRMIYDTTFPGRIRFIAHAVREISNRLPDVIAGKKSGGTVQYKNRLDDIIHEWKKAGFTLDGSIPSPITNEQSLSLSGIIVPPYLFDKFSTLLKDHIEAREKPEEVAFRLFEAMPGNQNQRDNLRPVILQWIEIKRWFMGLVHATNRVLDDNVKENELSSKFDIFERILSALVRDFFKTTGELDEILEDANS